MPLPPFPTPEKAPNAPTRRPGSALPPDPSRGAGGRSGTASAIAVIALAATPLWMMPTLLLPGCARSPVAANAARSPYERYDTLRGRSVPRTRIDSFGRERLNLEGRLGDPGGGP